MDFFGVNSRVISDPAEVQRVKNEIGLEISRTVKKKPGAFSPATVRKSILENKTWYHGTLNREQAVSKIKKHGSKEG